MLKTGLLILLLTINCQVFSQSFSDKINKHREEYKAEFLTSERSPLKEKDIALLRFYEADESYVTKATFTRTPDAKEFDMATYSGVLKKYIKYGTLSFSLNNENYVLSVYQGITLQKNPEYADYLFIPFKDFTNGVETYGGGRYIDYRIGDIVNGILELDFNIAYNPYCAYSDGYSCPIPPEENHLKTEIKAGEKKFGRDH